MNIRYGLLAATILVTPLAARAEAISGLYIGAGVGANWLNDTRLRSVDVAGTTLNLGKVRQRFDTGLRTNASVGYGFGNGLRVEIEGTYFQNSVTRIGRFAGGGGIGGSNFQPLPTSIRGDRLKYGGFVNVLYDFDPNILFGLGNAIPFPISPYIGAGAGYLQAKNSSIEIRNDGQNLIRSTGTDGNFAYQAIIGAAFPIAAVPGLAITAEYRFTGIADNTSFKGQYFAPGVATRAVLRESDQYNHSAMLGVRYAFNAAPPPPPPAPVPVAAPQPDVARTYLVFFDWDRADLTDRARQIIAEAAQATTRTQVTRIEVSGHTDSSGTARYNQGLSVRRAQNVAAELVRLGVPREAITTQGFGETRPLVRTADGVREPQNRRVEIVLR
jgi:outer membrane protein OmpA-like peptidoglycan-associated protein